MTKKAYQDFYKWFAQCPVKVSKHKDHVDTLDVTFELPYCDDEEEAMIIPPMPSSTPYS